MKKWLFLIFFMAAVLPASFAQNMLIVGGDFNPLRPGFWGGRLGFNLKLVDEYIQNDLFLSVGGIKAKMRPEEPEPEEEIPDEPDEETDGDDKPEEKPEKKAQYNTGSQTGAGESYHFFFAVKDALYFSLEGKYLGLRAGVTAALGAYFPNFPSYEFFIYGAGFAGISLFPKSLISLTVDICPGYIVAFHIKEIPNLALSDSGFVLPISVGIRFNIDKL